MRRYVPDILILALAILAGALAALAFAAPDEEVDATVTRTGEPASMGVTVEE